MDRKLSCVYPMVVSRLVVGDAVRLILALATVLLAGATPAPAQEVEYKNLEVLPHDITRSGLNRVMLGNLSGLGLPRRGGEGCLFCHAGNMDVPRREWDYASDERIQKRKAREMMAMTAEINERLQGLEGRVAPELRVTCYTCHKGRTDPRSLTDHMVEAYRASGVDSALVVYRDLRARYFGADAYDFRASTLFGLAAGVAGNGAYEDGIVLSRLNEEFNAGDASVRRGTLTLEVQQALTDNGVDAALSRFERALVSEAPGTLNFGVLDSVGWPLFRAGREQDALRIFRRNLEAFSDAYVPNESLAEALLGAGEREAGLRVMERWLDTHPDHEMAQRVLLNMRARGG